MTKLHSILRVDVDLDCHNMLIFGKILMDTAQNHSIGCATTAGARGSALTRRVYKCKHTLVVAIMHPIQTMEYYPRTGYGESKSFLVGHIKQGLCQGNTEVPRTW